MNLIEKLAPLNHQMLSKYGCYSCKEKRGLVLQPIALTAKLADLAGFLVYLAKTNHADHTQNTYIYVVW